MYSFPNLESVHCPCSNLTVASWPAHRSWVSWSGIPISLWISTVCCDPHSQRLWGSQWSKSGCFSGTLVFSMIQWMLAIWSLIPLPFLNPAWTSASAWFMYFWSLAWRILSITLLSCEMECNCAVVWTFFVIAFLWDWNENWPSPVLWTLLNFPNLLAYWVEHSHSIIF